MIKHLTANVKKIDMCTLFKNKYHRTDSIFFPVDSHSLFAFHLESFNSTMCIRY